MDTVGPANCKVNIEVEIETLLGGFSTLRSFALKSFEKQMAFKYFGIGEREWIYGRIN